MPDTTTPATPVPPATSTLALAPEPPADELEHAAMLGERHATTALRLAREDQTARGRTIPGDSDGAEIVWEYAPAVPYAHGTRHHDAYTDAWYEVVYDALTTGTPSEYTHPDEATLKQVRRNLIDQGADVSLIGWDTQREVYAFNVRSPR